MALGAMTVVAVSILTATTLLPALIAMLGDRVLPGGIVGRVERFFKHTVLRRPETAPAPISTPVASRFWASWTRRVMAHPWTAVIGVSAVLLVLASPLLSLQTGTNTLEQFPKGGDVRVGNELAAAETGGGADPVQIVAAFSAAPTPADRAAVAGFVREVGATAGVSAVAAPAYAANSVLIQATPRAASESDAAVALVERLRDSVVPGAALSKVASVNVGGETARSHDVRDQISGSMWKIILFVLALSFLVLMVMLRSLVLPLKAVLMNLLSIGAAFGVLVAIFQWGWLDGFLGFESQGALDTINVPLIFAVVFGLSMDYEVFADPRALHAPRRQRARRRRGPFLQRPDDLLGGADHDLRLRRLRPHRRPLDQGARPRLRRRDRPRRDPRPSDSGAGGDEADGLLELVDALLAGPRPARPQFRVGQTGAGRGLISTASFARMAGIKRSGTRG
jgi:RND superfamily putative drug exporter